MTRRGTAWRFAAAAAAIVAAELATATPASAHTIGGVQATNYESQVVGLSPPTPGVKVRLLDLGRRIQLTNTGSNELVVVGYAGEAYLRIGPAGVYQNIHSPAVYQNRPLPPGVTASTLPAIAQPAAAPQWQKISSGHSATWRDRRTRWEGPPPPAVAANPGLVTAVAGWAIPLRQGAVTIHLVGRIVWLPAPALLPWLGLAVAFFGLAVGVGWSRRWGQGLSLLVALLVAVDVARSYAAALLGGGPIWIEVLRTLTTGVFGALFWALGAWATALLQSKRERGLLIGEVTALGILLFTCYSDLPYLVHSQVPVAAPAGIARASLAVATGLSFGVAIACLLRFGHLLPGQRDELPDETNTD